MGIHITQMWSFINISVFRTYSVCVLSHFSCVLLFATIETVAHQAPLSMEFSRQEYWSGLSCSPLGYLCDPGIEPTSPALAGGFFTILATREVQDLLQICRSSLFDILHIFLIYSNNILNIFMCVICQDYCATSEEIFPCKDYINPLFYKLDVTSLFFENGINYYVYRYFV